MFRVNLKKPVYLTNDPRRYAVINKELFLPFAPYSGLVVFWEDDDGGCATCETVQWRDAEKEFVVYCEAEIADEACLMASLEDVRQYCKMMLDHFGWDSCESPWFDTSVEPMLRIAFPDPESATDPSV
jgi:hypothetical protein